MADERGSGHGKWTGGAQALAAVVGAFVALAGLVIGFWRPADEAPRTPAVSETVAPATPAPKPAQGPIAIEPARASLSYAGPADEADVRTLSAAVTIRITNNGDLPVGIAWLDGRGTAVLDLDDGTHLKAGDDTVFSGFPDCRHRKPDDCSRGGVTRLDPGESQVAMLSLSARTAKSDQARIAGATKGSLTGRLAVLPGLDEDAAYARSVSLELPLTNAAR
jgi:hypothetical protein